MSYIIEAIKKVYDLEQRMKGVEELVNEVQYTTQQTVRSALAKTWVTDAQSETYYGLRIGLCVDTKDPLAKGRIRFYLPGLHKKDTPLKSLPWANPISTLGGFDDSGCLWVPPAGAAVALVFEVGDRESAYYLGTTWNNDRGAPPHNWGYGIPEYQCVHQGHRKGYFVGANDESQVKPPSNTENYNIKDFDDLKAFEQDTNALKKITPSHIYMMKTPGKHRLKFDDGNASCNDRFKRLEMGSACGHTFLMWDDHMHASGQHLHPLAANCGPTASGGGGSGLNCGEGGCGGSISERDDPTPECGDYEDTRFKNDLFKQESECRAWRGPCTPQNNKCELQQTGVFLSSISGHVFVQDDEVDDPQGKPTWERGTSAFDFGCNDRFLGKTFITSATGHQILLGDAEDDTNIRSGEFMHPKTQKLEPNGIRLLSASGNRVELNDHTLNGEIAGQKRGITIESTSKHLFEMCDYTNEQKSPDRAAGGVPINNAKEAYVRLKTGYGLQLLMRDDHSQQETQNQFIELLAPHKDNCFGPHILRMQEEPSNAPGLVFLRAGGYFLGVSSKEWIEVVGDPDDPSGCGEKASKITKVTEHDINDVEEYYVQLSDLEYHHAEQYIILAAGYDCPSDDTQSPCLYPVVTGKKPWACPFTGQVHFSVESLSERVFAS